MHSIATRGDALTLSFDFHRRGRNADCAQTFIITMTSPSSPRQDGVLAHVTFETLFYGYAYIWMRRIQSRGTRSATRVEKNVFYSRDVPTLKQRVTLIPA